MNDERYSPTSKWSDDKIADQLSTYATNLDAIAASASTRSDGTPTPFPRFTRRAMAGMAAAAAIVAGVVGANQLFADDGRAVVLSPATPGGPDVPTVPDIDCPGEVFDPSSDAVYFDPAGLPVVTSMDVRTAPWGNVPGFVSEPGRGHHVEILYPLAERTRTDADNPIIRNMCDPSSDRDASTALASTLVGASEFTDDAPGTVLEIALGDGTYFGVYGTPGLEVDGLVAIATQFRWTSDPEGLGLDTWPVPPSTATTEPPRPLPAPTTTPATSDIPITFDGIGTQLDAPLEDADVGTNWEESTCGNWQGSTGLEGLSGIAFRDETSTWRVGDVRTASPAYRTASGLGVGSTLADLQRVYGRDLVVDRLDGWESPTDGLLASYQDVAAVANGDRAITYLMIDDVVTSVKVSTLDGWGDDEGCA